MNEKNEKVILIGKSGSGKSFLVDRLTERGLKPCLKWTTRPKRKNENQGKDYNFVDRDFFIKEVSENKFLSYQIFEVVSIDNKKDTWYYGLTNEEFNSSQVFVMTPGDFKKVSLEDRKKCFVVYLDIDRKTRENRLQIREDNSDSIKRRLDADDDDFKELIDYDLRITDPDFLVDEIYNLMD